MDSEPRYSVVVIYRDGMRDVRGSNVTLETAQATQATLAPVFPQALVKIEPPPPPSMTDTWRAGDTWRPR